MKMEVKIGVMCTNQEMPGTTRSWKIQMKDPLLETSQGARPCQHLDLALLASKTEKEQISVCSHPNLLQFVKAALGI